MLTRIEAVIVGLLLGCPTSDAGRPGSPSRERSPFRIRLPLPPSRFGPAGYSEVSEKKALKSVKFTSPQSSRHISSRGAGAACMPVSAAQPRTIANARFSMFPSSAFLGRDIGGIVDEGQ